MGGDTFLATHPTNGKPLPGRRATVWEDLMSCGVGLIDFALFLVTGSKAFSCQGLEQPAKPEEGKSKASFHIWCWGQELASYGEA